MLVAFNLSAIVVIGLMLGVILLFAWNLGNGVLRSRERSLRIVRRLTLVVATVTIIAGILGLITDLSAPELTMTVPVDNVWPKLPGVTIHQSEARIDGPGTALAQLTLTGVSFGVRMLWASGQLLGVLVPAAIALLVYVALRQLENDKPFVPLLSRITLIAGFVVLVGGTAAPVLRGVAGSMASYQALSISSAEYTGYPDDWSPTDALPQPTVLVQWEWWPIGVAVALFVLAAILHFGQRLQKDTEGLV